MYLRQALDVSREHGVVGAETAALIDLGTATFMLGLDAEAEAYARESADRFGASDIETIALLVLAGIAGRRGDRVLAARLLGASDALRAETGYEFEPAEQPVLATVREEMGDALDDPVVRSAYDQGRALDHEEATALVGHLLPPASTNGSID